MNTLLNILLVVNTIGIAFVAMGITMITINRIFRGTDKTKNKNIIIGASNCFSGAILIIGSIFVHTLIAIGNTSTALNHEDGFCILIALIGILYYVRTIRMAVFCDEEDEENK